MLSASAARSWVTRAESARSLARASACDTRTVNDEGSRPKAPATEVKPTPVASQPEIRIGYGPAGRGTLDAITEELAPHAPEPERESSSPELMVEERAAERDTLSAILSEASAVERPSSAVAELVPLEIFEMLTFVVRGSEAQRMSSDASRQRFVEEHLLPRLPVASMSDVERVEVTPWTTPGALVVRIWCRMRR